MYTVKGVCLGIFGADECGGVCSNSLCESDSGVGFCVIVSSLRE